MCFGQHLTVRVAGLVHKGHRNVAILTCVKELQSIMPFVIMQIRCGSRVLKPWYGCVVAEEADVSSDYSGGILDSGPSIPEDFRTACVEAAVYIGSTKNDKVRVSPHCPIGQAVSSLGQYVEFCVSSIGSSRPGSSSRQTDEEGDSSRKSAFALLMATLIYSVSY